MKHVPDRQHWNEAARSQLRPLVAIVIIALVLLVLPHVTI